MQCAGAYINHLPLLHTVSFTVVLLQVTTLLTYTYLGFSIFFHWKLWVLRENFSGNTERSVVNHD